MKFNFFKKVWGKKEKEESKNEIPITKKDKIEIKFGENFKILPLITEKAFKLARENKYIFLVESQINKNQIKKAIEKMFNVKVNRVRTMNYKKRERGLTKIKSVRPRFKKAIVELKEGQTINIFE